MRYIIAAIILVIASGLYFLLKVDSNSINQPANANTTTYSNSDVGLEFTYPTGPEGYVLQDMTSADTSAGLVRTLVLVRSEDAARTPPEGGEYPPTITIRVFKNLTSQEARAWADSHTQFSNTNLKMSDIADTVVGGANAIRYTADGLYASDNVVVAHGDNVYVFTGMYLDEASPQKKDFGPLIASVRFIPEPGQP